METCKGCYFALPVKSGIVIGQPWQGECTACPPQIIAVPTVQGLTTMAAYPPVTDKQRVCGMYKGKEEVPFKG